MGFHMSYFVRQSGFITSGEYTPHLGSPTDPKLMSDNATFESSSGIFYFDCRKTHHMTLMVFGMAPRSMMHVQGVFVIQLDP